MFDILELNIKDFKSYKGKHSFNFPEEAGLYYLTGKNEKNSRLGANGVGKTSLMDAISWCLFGRTYRGLRSSDVITWGKKSCTVSLKINIIDKFYEIERQQNPNKILIDGQPVDQDQVTNLIRLNTESFHHAIILPQFGRSFFDLKPAEKMTLFSNIMELDFWLEKSKIAAEIAGNITNIIQKNEILVSKIEGKIEATKDDLKELKKSSASFKDEIAKEINELKDRKQTLIKALGPVTKEYTDYYNQCQRYENLDSSYKQNLDCLLDERSETQEALTYLKADLHSLFNKITENHNKESRLEKLQGTVCVTCSQQISASHIDKQRKMLNDENNKIERQEDKLKTEIKKIEDHLQTVSIKVKDLKNKIDKKETEIRILTKKRNDIGYKAKEIEHKIDDITNRITKTKVRKNPYVDMINDKVSVIETMQQDVEKGKKEIKELNEKLMASEYWVKGFKQIRLFVIEEAIKNFEIEINNSLANLGLIDWQVTIDVERETKSGGITKGFTVSIKNPQVKKPVKWESWSGGETQRLLLAGDLGLANLILERVGFISKVEFHDEPSEHLSPEGINDMMETLHERALDKDKKIWLVDHQTTNFGGFNGVLNIVMNEKGSSNFEYKQGN